MLLEAGLVERKANHPRRSDDDRSVARVALQHGDLAELFPHPQLGDDAAVDDDLGGALGDDVELMVLLPLLDNFGVLVDSENDFTKLLENQRRIIY